jgi:predicted N-acetyltransferase YhbS
VRIRPATERDDVEVGELLVHAFEDTYRRLMPEVVMSDERRVELRAVAAKRAVAQVWVADEGGKVVGTVAVWAPGAPDSEAFLPGAASLRHLAVTESHRKTGVAAELMDVAERWAREQGAAAVCLHVRRGVRGVARLYEARGYQRRPEGDLDFLPEVFLEGYVLTL